MRSNGTLSITPHRFKSSNKALQSLPASSLSQQKKANGKKLYVVNLSNSAVNNQNKLPVMSKQNFDINTKSTVNIIHPSQNKGSNKNIFKAKSPNAIQMKNNKNTFRLPAYINDSNNTNSQNVKKRVQMIKSVNITHDYSKDIIQQVINQQPINNLIPLPKIKDEYQTPDKSNSKINAMRLVNKGKVIESYKNNSNEKTITIKDIEKINKEAQNIIEDERLKEIERLNEAETIIDNIKEGDKQKNKEQEKNQMNFTNPLKTVDKARNKRREIEKIKSNSIVLSSKISMGTEDKLQLRSHSFINDNTTTTIAHNHINSFKSQSQKQIIIKDEIHTNQEEMIIEKKIKMYLNSHAEESQAGKSDGGIIKTNQDSYLVMIKVFDFIDFNIFGVLDGHGENGHFASRFSSNYIDNKIRQHPILIQLKSIDEIYDKLRENKHDIIKQLFISAHKEIIKQDFNVQFSGTTCVIIFQLGTHIISANAGDSRGILISEVKDDSYEVKYLSIDQKPELKKEKNRIIKAGGRVDQYEDEGEKVGPFRVWLKDQPYPGLAMSRSIGDLIASEVGVIPEPAILEFELSKKKECIIVASDGVWEFLDNKNVMTLAKPFIGQNDLNHLCSLLIQKSTKKWEEEDTVVDDITVVTALFMHCK